MADQVDFARGTPELGVEQDHLARSVWSWVGELEVSVLDRQRSWLGRHGFEPRRLLAVWVYASLMGVHAAARVAEATKTDLAYRYLSGGHVLGERTLSRFRAENRAFFTDALSQTVALALAHGLVDPKALAVDSMRLRAKVSTASVRTRSRSTKRLEELSRVDVPSLSSEERERHTAKVEKHATAVWRCESEGRTSHSVTDPQASLMKFPSGAAQPGHRVTVGASGTTCRLVMAAFVDGAPTDYGKLEEAVTSVEQALVQAGVVFDPGDTVLQIATDAGYLAEEDLRFAAEVRPRIDLLIPIPEQGEHTVGRGSEEKQLGKDRFTIREDGTAICPAGTVMAGPKDHPSGTRTWRGVGCGTCPLKSQCTSGKARTLSENLKAKALRDAMRTRMSLPDARQRYSQRIATVEPVFGYLEDAMAFPRASSRRTATVVAEVLLKLVAYNLLRIHTARHKASLDCVHVRALG